MKRKNSDMIVSRNPNRATMSDIPLDVFAGILSRLAVDPLLRFRCVSKTWCALIDSSEFIKLHLNNSIQTNSHRKIILEGRNLCSIDFDSLENAVQLNHSISPPTDILLGCCNGLLCLSNTDQHVFLWNPSTRKYHKLPVSPFDYVDLGCPKKQTPIAYGLGYDDVADDYKVVRIVQWYVKNEASFRSQLQIYSLKFNSWRRIGVFPYSLVVWRPFGVLVAGALHWLVSGDGDPNITGCDLIAAFDIKSEKHWLVPLPEYSNKNFWMRLEVLGGCLCANYSFVFGNIVDIWVMKDYGVKESWTKLISFSQPFDYPILARPLAYSKSGEQVLLAYGCPRLIWYDLKEKTIENVSVGGMLKFYEAIFCLGSLVQPNCGGESDGKEVTSTGDMVEE